MREGTSGEVLSALDVLAMANLINYFGKSESADAVEVAPVLLAKGSTRLALYGLGSIRDDRLHRVLLAGKMTFRRPARDADAFFNLMLMRVVQCAHIRRAFVCERRARFARTLPRCADSGARITACSSR